MFSSFLWRNYDFITGILDVGGDAEQSLSKLGLKLDEDYIFEYVLRCSYDIFYHMLRA